MTGVGFNYLYDGLNVIEELDSGGSVLARYMHGAVIDEDLSMLRSGGTSYYQMIAFATREFWREELPALASDFAKCALPSLMVMRKIEKNSLGDSREAILSLLAIPRRAAYLNWLPDSALQHKNAQTTHIQR